MVDFRSSKKYLEVTSLGWNTTNSLLAYGTSTGDIEIVDFKKRTAVAAYSKKNYDGIKALKFSPFSKNLLCSGCKDGSVGVYSIQQPDLVSRYWKLHTNKVTGLGFTHLNEDLVISCSLDETIAFLDLRQKKVANTIKTDTALTCLSIAPNGYYIVAGSYFGEIKGIDMRKDNTSIMKYKGHKNMVKSIDFSQVTKSHKRNDSMSVVSNAKTSRNEGYSRISDKKEQSFINDASLTKTVNEMRAETPLTKKSGFSNEPKSNKIQITAESEYETGGNKPNGLVKPSEVEQKVEEKLQPKLNGIINNLSANDKDEIKEFIRSEINELRLDMIKEFELQRFEFRKMMEEIRGQK